MKKLILCSLLVSSARLTALAQQAESDASEDRLNARLSQLAVEHNGTIPAKDLLALWKQFPAAESLQMLMDLQITETMDSDLRRKMLLALRDTPGVSEEHRAFALQILTGQLRPLAMRLGEKLPLKFKALDGREVDLAKLHGKVVLLDFWATWCGPCVAGLPEIKRVYEQFHSHGFEIIGINFDEERSRLENFVRQENMSWPQYFEGRVWDNQIGKEFCIRILPTISLVDKNGILRFVNAREDFSIQIQKLLSE